MKTIYRKHFVVVEAETGQEYAQLVNAYYANTELRNVEVDHRERHNFCAYVTYEEVERVPEDLKDEYELMGVAFTCGDCPHRQHTEDRRVKRFACNAGVEAYVCKCDPACNRFYEELQAGKLLEVKE